MGTALSVQSWSRRLLPPEVRRAEKLVRRCALLGALCGAGWACSPGAPTPPHLSVVDGDPEGPVFYDVPSDGAQGGAATGSGDEPMGLYEEMPATSNTIDPEDACASEQRPATLVKQPVDIIVLLDNSGSMADEAAAVEANININFAGVLTSSQVDYRVILITRHRTEPRDPGNSDKEEANTSVCVQVPLSNLASCENADEPVFSERFFQYSTKVESDDSFDIVLDTYSAPFADDEREDKYEHAPDGWRAWLRPGAKKVFLEVTDDNEDMSVGSFVTQLQSMAPDDFGTDPEHPTFVFHSIVGLEEKATPTDAYLATDPLTSAKCSGNCLRENQTSCVTSAGETYQELSRLTGGLRFPLCQFEAYDVVFNRIAEDVVLKRDVACDFDIPDVQRGLTLNLDNIAIAYSLQTQGSTAQLGQAATPGDCAADAFYIDSGRLNLCPEACATVRSDPSAAITVLFTCQSQIIVR